nr:MAG: RNA-binding protein [Actinidia virus B]
MDDSPFLKGRSSFARRRRANKLGICKCGAICVEHEPNCRKQAISLHKIQRLEWVERGRVAESETLYPLLKYWISRVYPLCEHSMQLADNCYCVECLCDRLDLLVEE